MYVNKIKSQQFGNVKVELNIPKQVDARCQPEVNCNHR